MMIKSQLVLQHCHFIFEKNRLGSICALMLTHLIEDEVSDEQEEESRHESREQRGDEPR